MTIFHQTIRDYAHAIGTLNADAFVACFSADCELNEPVGAPAHVGQEGARTFFNGMAPLISKIEFRAGPVYLCGQRAAFSWTIEAEGKSGQASNADGIDIFEFNEAGKIARSVAYWDPGPFVAALLK